MKTIKARPKTVPVVCICAPGSRGTVSKLLLGKNCVPREIGPGISTTLGAAALKELLPALCEHSERVCLGRYYAEIFEEHWAGRG